MSSLFSEFNKLITIIVLLLLCGNIALVIWSYTEVEQYIKLVIAIPRNNILQNGFQFIYTEFALKIYTEMNYLWESGAWPDAVAIFIASYIWPFLKVFMYIILWFIPNIMSYYKYQILWLIHQFHRVMWIMYYANIIESASFSFDIVIPILSTNYNETTEAETYPGKGIILHVIAIVIFYFIDYLFYFFIYWTDKDNKNDIKWSNNSNKIIPKSYIGILWYSFIVILSIANIWICIEAIYSSPVRFEVKGVLGFFVPNYISTNNIEEMGNLITKSPLANKNYTNFLLMLYYLITIIIPIIVCVLLLIFWILPLFIDYNKKNDGGKNKKIYLRFLQILWFLEAWNGSDVLWICINGVPYTEQTSKYMVDGILPQLCGEGNLIYNIFGTDCCFSTGNYGPKGMILLTITVFLQHFLIHYAQYIFGEKIIKSSVKKQQISINK